MVDDPNSCPCFICRQVLVKKSSPLIGQTIRAIGFRGRFKAAVIAVKRSKNLQPGRIGDMQLQARDVLVLSTGAAFDATTPEFTENFERWVIQVYQS